MRLLATTYIAALALMLVGSDLAALPIVRIGGQGLPVPERADDEGGEAAQDTPGCQSTKRAFAALALALLVIGLKRAR